MLPSCLAFAAAVIGGQKNLGDCPFLSEDNKKMLSRTLEKRSTAEAPQAEFMVKLLTQVEKLDFAAVALERGGSFHNNVLSVMSLGKVFHVDRKGMVRSECHVIPWVEAPRVHSQINPSLHLPGTPDVALVSFYLVF